MKKTETINDQCELTYFFYTLNHACIIRVHAFTALHIVVHIMVCASLWSFLKYYHTYSIFPWIRISPYSINIPALLSIDRAYILQDAFALAFNEQQLP